MNPGGERKREFSFEDFLEQSPPYVLGNCENIKVLREDPKQYIFWKLYALCKSNNANVYTVFVYGSTAVIKTTKLILC